MTTFGKVIHEGGACFLWYSYGYAVTGVSVATTVTRVDCLVSKLCTRRGRLYMAVIYRPPSSTRHGVSVAVFCREFIALLLLAITSQPAGPELVTLRTRPAGLVHRRLAGSLPSCRRSSTVRRRRLRLPPTTSAIAVGRLRRSAAVTRRHREQPGPVCIVVRRFAERAVGLS